MTRTPLRPLASVLTAREKGENPEAIARENLRRRHEAMRDRARNRAAGRLVVLALSFFCAFSVIGLRMGQLAASEAAEPRAATSGSDIVASRANIVDRNGRILATNLSTHSLYAQTPDMVDPYRAAEELAAIFPDLDAERLKRDFTGQRKFLWIKKKLSPEQMQAVHDIGEPGLMFGPREMRLYPNGQLAAHVLGGASFGREGVHSAEVVGVAGVEKAFDGWLRDPANNGAPLELSIDLTVQAAAREVLAGGMRLLNAKGASAVLMDVHTGEILAMVSLPDFDPNKRPRPLTMGNAGDSPLFNRAVQGVYELGSVFKIFAVAQAMDLGLVNPDTMIDAHAPMRWGKFKINEFRNKNYGTLSVTDVIVNSSNVGTAKIALAIGAERQKAFLGSLGLFEPTSLELVEAPTGKPLVPSKWSEISTITISYGHGLSSSPVHLAAAYASVLNGGTRVTPTLLKRTLPQDGPRVVSEEASKAARSMLRQVVQRGTASFGEVPGYAVGGKTGSADKPKPKGGYYKDKLISTFASVFPAHDPRYVLILTLDEPVETSGDKPRRTAGWTAVPVAAEMIRRTAPLLGLRPGPEPEQKAKIVQVSN
ncbi:penicillin-binding protein 2 [Tropicimonas sp. IMCC6043]|uniref:peptidoglycan D,D-transpeptidase FtsI family protein n=1 Tax=Tropicimonas sp. IMCC6043 TaxID=2510645 RepID=UPI00101C5FB9|nr:penicillin-binding protein 2 [Tropicimonas sp. IMCC6043]RYH07653.1 penicillin-binding protein 2 [Tropicimonas sp. IMCC6043]